MAVRYGFDLSNYSRVPDYDRLAYLRSQGLDFAIVGTQIGSDGLNYTQQQIDALWSVGIQTVGVYELMYWDGWDSARFSHAMSFGYPVWIDLEVEPNRSAVQVVQSIWDVINQLGNKFAGIYTGRWWWSRTGETTQFGQFPLWIADWRSNFSFDNFVPFGGWTRPQFWQYSNRCLNDVVCDLNAWEVNVAPGPPNPPPPGGLPPGPPPTQIPQDFMLVVLGLGLFATAMVVARPGGPLILKKIIQGDGTIYKKKIVS